MQNSQPQPTRRNFFAGAATVGAAAAAVVALPRVAPAPDTAAAEPMRVAPEKGGGYHLSAHVKQYYKTTQL
ncbi:MAG: formate dehydrogenase [Comamonadaceae bacterium]|nr:MAG: formate dehydrogenase [Comamonadaceae bacterium]